ncbi:hypothetical protein K438DRAFT_1972926 [Mycena galopus ATCC 62051]|nr:hypothetical protein K438DRAFT_1972926 [Mycena galopus ATCC 62051]
MTPKRTSTAAKFWPSPTGGTTLPIPDWLLTSRHWSFLCPTMACSTQQRAGAMAAVSAKKGLLYRFRLINISTHTNFLVSIDNCYRGRLQPHERHSMFMPVGVTTWEINSISYIPLVVPTLVILASDTQPDDFYVTNNTFIFPQNKTIHVTIIE